MSLHRMVRIFLTALRRTEPGARCSIDFLLAHMPASKITTKQPPVTECFERVEPLKAKTELLSAKDIRVPMSTDRATMEFLNLELGPRDYAPSNQRRAF